MRLVFVLLGAMLTSSDWRAATPSYDWSFPRDHWAHDDYRTEWWYFTGPRESALGPKKEFAYQFTFFRVGLLHDESTLDSNWAATHLVMGHAAVIDLTTGRRFFSEVRYREVPFLAGFAQFPERQIGWCRGPAGTKELWTLDWNGSGFDFSANDGDQNVGFRLSTKASKPLVLHGPNGFSQKSEEPGSASQYYSFTRLETVGELKVAGVETQVRGTSWMDKEFSSSHLRKNQIGWDWFSLSLEDGRDFMLYLMRDEDGTVDFASGTVVYDNGTTRFLKEEDFTVEPLQFWTSSETRARYPIRWKVAIPSEGVEFDIRPLYENQENKSRLPGGVHYWEGSVLIEGMIEGRGFVELTGYGEGNRPPV